MPLRWIARPGGFQLPRRDLDRLRSHLEGMYDALTDGFETIRTGGAGVYPMVNVYEDPDNLYVTAELPGTNPADLDLSVHGDDLVIRGERKSDMAAKVNYHRREREAGAFRRVIALPVKIDPDKVQAKMRDGILLVTLAKSSEAKTRKVSVEAV
jgi:HSP20 family protein